MSLQYNIIFQPYQSFEPPSSTVGEIGICSRGLFCTKFNSEQLLFEAFFVWCVLLAVLSPKLNVETGTNMENTEHSHSVTSQCCAPTGSSNPCRIITLGTHDASCLAYGNVRTTSNICTCKQGLCWLTSMEQADILAYKSKLKIFNFFGASNAVRVNLQCLYTVAKVCKCFISVASILSKTGLF